MKKAFLALLYSCLALSLTAQITTPITRAGFEIDGGLRANLFVGPGVSNGDDWYSDGAPGIGVGVIDTTGAGYIRQLYINNPSTRTFPLFRGMAYPQFSIVNNRMLIDAVFIRDHHGADSSTFANGSNKNGMSPAVWAPALVQSVPNKTDILDMFMHVRREGPAVTDSLWLFGGVSLEGTGGNRYFDFEMYQTDIYYERSTLSFRGYGPDEGHTAWQFDAAGNVTQAGDIIFTAEYGGSGLTNLEARIWVKRTALTTVSPVAFAWGGIIDGATGTSTYGYANIRPTTAGTFYTGLQSADNAWAGPFNLVRVDNSVVTNFLAGQFLEFSVNLSKLGVDPLVAIGDACKMPFRRILVKSRTSASFSSELKDFVGPFDFFRAPMASASANIPMFCGTTGISTLSVATPLLTSLYTWSTADGHFASDTIGPTVMVDQPGTYVVSQMLMDSCGSTYARDTVVVTLDPLCTLLNQKDPSGKFDYNRGPARRAVSLRSNPATNHLRIAIATPVAEDAVIQVHDLSGRILQVQKTRMSPGSALIDIPCPVSWRSGTYVVKVVMGNQVFTEKLLLIR